MADLPRVLAGQRVLVVGAGVTGQSVVNALLMLGADVAVTVTGGGRLDTFAAANPGVHALPGLDAVPADVDLVVTSPGIRPTDPLLAGSPVEVIGDVELAWRVCSLLPDPPDWLAVTGTNGKTTTVGMLESILRAAGHDAVACGNIGLAVLDAVLAGHRTLAVELSSFQLHWQSSLAPAVSVVLNVAEDHLDWHGDLDAYAADKARIYTRAAVRVANADDAWSSRLAGDGTSAASREGGVDSAVQVSAGKATEGSSYWPVLAPFGNAASGMLGRRRRVDFSGRGTSFTVGEPKDDQYGVRDGWLVAPGGVALCPVAEVRPPGPHNVSNALAASALATEYGVAPDAVRAGLVAYQPGAHRSVLVAERDGVRYVDDSKATNPHAAAGSLHAFDSVVWIAGGQLKGASVDELVVDVAPRLRGVVLIGVDQGVIFSSLARHAPDVPVHRVTTGDDEPMIAAVRAASAIARPGDVVLLAPAAASLDMFVNYAARGQAFIDAVGAL